MACCGSWLQVQRGRVLAQGIQGFRVNFNVQGPCQRT